jgi:hypothetical protein
MFTPIRPAAGALAALATAGLALGLTAPAAGAQTQGVGGSAVMRYAASGGTDCTVTLQMWNGTNGAYTIDFLVDDQAPFGPDYGTGQTGYRWTGALNPPQFSIVEPKVAYNKAYPLLESSRTFNLLALSPQIPNRDSDTHTVRYRVILGPATADRGPLPASGWYETQVSGCHVTTTATLDAPATAEPNTPVDLTVTVTPGAAGTVQFFDNGVPIGEPVAVVDGVATLSHAFDTVGTHAVTATFTPTEPRFVPSDAGPVTVTVQDPVTPPGPGTGSLGSLGAGSLGLLCGEDGAGSSGSSGSAGSSSSDSTGPLCEAPGGDGEAGAGSSGSLVEINAASNAGSGE